MRRVSELILGIALSATCSSQTVAQRTPTPNPLPQAGSRPAAQNSSSTASDRPLMHFRDVSADPGITTVPHTRTDRRYVLDTMSAGGIALLDCDHDGKLDIAVVNDSTIEQF